MKVRFISATTPFIEEAKSPEDLIMYCARVSSNDQTSGNSKLLSYLIKNKHWSPFEMVDMTVEIITSRAISPQILRHRSFVFQEFSQRYAKVEKFEKYGARKQDLNNRQNSTENLTPEDQYFFDKAQDEVIELATRLYDDALSRGIAKECARVLLPLSSETKLYMKGSLRSWIHYLEVRTDIGSQKEHQNIAEEVQKIFKEQFPIISEALGWST